MTPHADRTTDRKSDMPGRVFRTMGIGIHCNIRIYLYTLSFTAYALSLCTGFGTDWCSTLFRLGTSDFVFLFQVFRIDSLLRARLDNS